ncbi:hypothetical protein PV325_002296 [Microctonus aethiopoides]|uniref:Uncharacterized protein n=1 Tax=Microctonus aethiopoides TaxID=144406 RepID=A0AA39KTT0_9HYME|nr:hypothetical protein PV325_002296 [Microctonus aethiopoides]KAK0173442.1 hypothetical protein PV328_006636 [Microctonus aethiopoides]
MYKTVRATATELAIITVCALMITTDATVNGYTISSRNRDYTNSGYSGNGASTSGFVGLSKDSHADLSDQLSSSSAYIPSNSQRYSTVGSGSHSSPAASYSSATYADSAQSNGYTSHSSNTPDSLNTITNSYTSDGHASSETSPPGYATGSSNTDGYSTSNSHGATAYSGYTSGQLANSGGLSGSDHTSSIEYNSSPSSSHLSPSSPLTSYVIAGPKAAAYTASSHSHPSSPFAASGHNFISSGHSSFPGSSHSSSYPGSHLSSYSGNRHSIANFAPGNSHSSHNSYSDGSRFSTSPLSSFLSPHSGSGPSSFIHSSGTSSHRGGIPQFLLGASSNINPTFPKGPGSFYPGPAGAFAKNGNKFIIIKESPGNHASLMHPGEPSFPSRMFTGSTGFKVKSASPYASGPHPGSIGNFASGLHLSPGYPGAGGGHHSGGPSSSYFAYQ